MLKVLITGPESSGKTQLAQFLARRFQCPWVPEFARTYLEALTTEYAEDDLLNILNGQLRLQQQQLDQPLIFCDTGPEVIYVWSKVKFGRVDPYIEESLRKYPYHLNLLCYPDLPWEPDPLREAPALETRQQLFREYEALFKKLNRPYLRIQGEGEQRVEAAITAIHHLLNSAPQSGV